MPRAETRQPDLQPLMLPRERAAAKLRAGRPLLDDEPVVLDLPFAADLFQRLAAARCVDVGVLDLDGLLTEAFVQHADHVRQIAGQAGLEAESIAELAEQAVRPLRRAYAQRLAWLVEDWQRAYCPICGTAASPVGSDRHGLGVDQQRLGVEVRCSACGFGWLAAMAGPTTFRIELAVPEQEDA